MDVNCTRCDRVINMDTDNVSVRDGKYYHTECYNELFPVAKPCPFCGEDNTIVETHCDGLGHLRKWWVFCRHCKCEGPWSSQGELGAVTMWNEWHLLL